MDLPGESYPRLSDTSFVVRLWLEGRDVAGPPEWRCHVLHVQSGEQTHCRFLEELRAFIERQAGVPASRFFAPPDRGEEMPS